MARRLTPALALVTSAFSWSLLRGRGRGRLRDGFRPRSQGGNHNDPETGAAVEANALYDKLEHAILPLYYGKPDAFTEIRRSTIALNGSFFHSQRMVLQYVRNAYLGVEP